MEWVPLGAEDFMDIEYIRRLDEEFLELAALREEIFGERGDVWGLGLFTSSGDSALATVAFMNRIERNIDALAGIAPPEGMKPTRVWRGGNLDREFLDFRDVNRWFESVAVIRASLLGRRQDFRRTGTFYAGASDLRQIVRGI